MRVWVVRWEYPESSDGFVAGVVGVAATPEAARRLADAEAVEYLALRDDMAGEEHVVQIEDLSREGDVSRFPDGAPSTPGDWDLWLTIEDHEVAE